MSSYLYSKWKDSPAGCPVEFYSELDDFRYETRKVEVFKDGKLGFASSAVASDDTQLGIVPVPPMSEIISQTEFESREISQREFEDKWQAATKK